MTRVLFVIPGLGTGGAERSLLEELPGLVQQGIDPVVACFHERREGVHDDVASSGIALHVVKGPLRDRFRHVTELARHVKPDLIHTSVYEADVAGTLAGTLLGTPVVSTLVNTAYDAARLKDPSVSMVSLEAHRAIDIALARRRVGHRALTQAVKSSSCRRLYIDPSTVTVIPRGRDVASLRFSAAQRRRAREALGLGPGDFAVGHVGRHEYQKGVDTLVSAMALVRRRQPQARLFQAGREGAHTDAIRRAADAAGLGNDGVVFLGHRQDVGSAILPALDLFAFPSRYEGLGGAGLEAMAAGLPIVASDIEVLREVLGSAASFVPSDDPQRLAQAIEGIIAARLTIPVRSSIERAGMYDIAHVTDHVADWLHAMAAEAQPRTAVPVRSRVRSAADRILSSSIVSGASWRWLPGELRVLAYHGVPDAGLFESQLDLICATAAPVSMSDVVAATNGESLPDRAVLVTFDDGDPTVLDHALPLLSERDMPAACFVIGGLVDSALPFWWAEVADHLANGVRAPAGYPATSDGLVASLKAVPDVERRRVIDHLRDARGLVPEQRNLTSEDLWAMERSGMEIGNHTLTHPCLDMCDESTIHSEISGSDGRLADILGHRVATFAYPNGNTDPRVLEAVRKVGYDAAFLFDHRVTRLDRPLAISRLRANATDSLERLGAVLSGAHATVNAARAR